MEVISWLFSIRWLWLCKVDKLMRIYVKIFWVLFVFLLCVPLSLTRAINQCRHGCQAIYWSLNNSQVAASLTQLLPLHQLVFLGIHEPFPDLWLNVYSLRCKSYTDYGIYSVISTSANRAVFQGQTHYYSTLTFFLHPLLQCSLSLRESDVDTHVLLSNENSQHLN